jgi:hypothetical protein
LTANVAAAEGKARFTDQVGCRRADADETGHSGDAVSYSEVKTPANRNPLLMDNARADAELAGWNATGAAFSGMGGGRCYASAAARISRHRS